MELNVAKTTSPTICLLGGTGFVGHHLASQLVNDGYCVRILARHRERHRALLVLPNAYVIEADVHDPRVLEQHFSGCDAVINLVAILNEKKKGDFDRIHIGLPHSIAQACQTAGVRRLLHMSALNADALNGTSRYLKSKGKGEDLVHEASDLDVTSFRPAVIFGPDDHFFNRFATLLKISPLFFPLACPRARFAPVFVGDVVQAFSRALDNNKTVGQRYDLCGPQHYTLQQLVSYTGKILGLRRKVVGLGDGLSRLQAQVMELLPGKPFSYDNYLSLQTDCVCKGEFPEIFSITPQTVESQVPGYLLKQNRLARFLEFQKKARHEP